MVPTQPLIHTRENRSSASPAAARVLRAATQLPRAPITPRKSRRRIVRPGRSTCHRIRSCDCLDRRTKRFSFDHRVGACRAADVRSSRPPQVARGTILAQSSIRAERRYVTRHRVISRKSRPCGGMSASRPESGHWTDIPGGPFGARGDLRRPFQALIYFLTQEAKIYGFGQQPCCSKFYRSLSGLIVSVSSYHNDRDIRARFPDLRKHLKAAHTGHVDVREDQDQRWIRDSFHLFKRGKCRESKFHAANRPKRKSRRKCWRNMLSTSGSSSTTTI